MNLTDNSIYKFERKSNAKDTYQVKVTSELLEDLENIQALNEVIININDKIGTLTIPLKNNITKVFNLNVESISRSPMESLEMILFRPNKTVESISQLNSRLNVQATSKVYDVAMKKMFEMEDENKKHCSREPKLTYPNKNNLSNTVVQNKDTRKIESKLINPDQKKISSSIILNKSNHNDDIKKTPQFTIREKVLHLLVLKPSSKDGILLGLRKLGVTSSDRIEVEKHLKQVATLNKDNMYQLSNQFICEIRDDWPQFNDESRKRIAKLKLEAKSRLPGLLHSSGGTKATFGSPKSNRSGRHETISPAESNSSSSKSILSTDEGFVSGDKKSPLKFPNGSNQNKRQYQHLSNTVVDERARKIIHLSDKNSFQRPLTREDLNSSSSCDVTPKSDLSQMSNSFLLNDTKLDLNNDTIINSNKKGPIKINDDDIEGTQARFNIAFEEYSKLCAKLKEHEDEVEKLRSKCKNAKNSDYGRMYKIAKTLHDQMETPQFQATVNKVKSLESEMCGYVRILTGQQLN